MNIESIIIKIRSNPRIYAVAGILLVIVGYFIFYILTHSIVTVSSSSTDETNISIVKSGDNLETQNFSLNNSSKTLLLRKGDYTIAASQGNNETLYQRSFKGLSKYTIDTEVDPQKQMSVLGTSEFDCSHRYDSSYIVFFRCGLYSGVLHARSDGGSVQQVIDPLVEQLSVHDHGPGEEKQEAAHSYVFKPYGAGYLTLASAENLLYIQSLSARLGSPAVREVPNFPGAIYNEGVSVRDGDERLAIFNSTEKKLYVYKSTQDANPQIIKLGELIQYDFEQRLVRVALGKDVVYVFDSSNPEDIEDHSSVVDEASPETLDQKIHVINLASGSIVKTHDLPDDMRFKSIMTNESDKLLLQPTPKDGYRRLYIADKNTLKELVIPHADIGSVCWKNSDELYYSTLVTNQFYLYNLPKNAAFLIASNIQGGTGEILCNKQGVFMSYYSDLGGTDDYIHNALSDKDIVGAQIDGRLPIYIDVGPDTLKISKDGDAFVIDQIANGDNNASTPDKGASIAVVREKFTELGVDLDKVEYRFSY